MNANTYIVRLLLSMLIVVVVVVGINYTIDPYGITGAARIAGLNQYKVDINDFTRINKKYQPLGREHDAIILGNSRVEMGINPAHACFGQTGLTTYNLGMPGADVRTQMAYALNLVYQQPVREIFLSVDFIDFISTETDPVTATPLLEEVAGELRYLPAGAPNTDYFQTLVLDYYKALFSLDALVSSFRTAVMQDQFAPDRDELGFNPGRDFAGLVQVEGPRALFDQKMQNLSRKYSQDWYLRNTSGALGSPFDDLQQFLEVVRERDITVYFFTHPFHESYWALLKERGLLPLYEDWKTAIVAGVRDPLRPADQFWDFSGESPYIHEPVPEAGVKTGPLQWFWEPAHYNADLGDLMVEAMLSDRCGSTVRFGQRVF